MLSLTGQYSLDGRLGIRLDAQEYLFSSSFRVPYTGQFVGAPVQPGGSQFRHELVVLAGLSWLTHEIKDGTTAGCGLTRQFSRQAVK